MERCWCHVSGSQSTGYPNTSPTVGFRTAMGIRASPHTFDGLRVRCPFCRPARRCSGLAPTCGDHNRHPSFGRLAHARVKTDNGMAMMRAWCGPTPLRPPPPPNPPVHARTYRSRMGFDGRPPSTPRGGWIYKQLTLDSARPPGLQSSRVRYPPKTLNKASILAIRPFQMALSPSPAFRRPANKNAQRRCDERFGWFETPVWPGSVNWGSSGIPTTGGISLIGVQKPAVLPDRGPESGLSSICKTSVLGIQLSRHLTCV